jgi:hypothetical protein
MILDFGSDTHLHEDESISHVENDSDIHKEGDNISDGLHTMLTICIL